MREVRGARGQSQPWVHRLLITGRGGRRETRVGEAANCDAACRRAAITFPEQASAAIRAEMKAKIEAAVALSRVDLVLAFDPHLAVQPAAAVMNDRAGAALAGLAMTESTLSGSPEVIARS